MILRLILALSLLAPLALSGCLSKSQWSRKPPLEVPDSFASEDTSEVDIKTSLLQLFAHPQLDDAVAQALEFNPDLLQARARLDEVAYSLRKTKSFQLPTLDATGGVGRSDTVVADPDNFYTANFDARWEVDIWGKLRNAVQASKADLAEAEANYRLAQQSLVGQTMQAWFTLVSSEKLLQLDKRRIAAFESTEKLVSRRFDLGESTLTELNLALSDLENARADLQRTSDNRDKAARNLQTLMGAYPLDLYEKPLEWPTLSASIAADLPSDLLIVRPDIVAAYQAVIAADARVSLTQKDIFPSFRLTANGGRRSSELEDLADSAFNSWTALASLAVNLFDGGARRADIGAASKRAEQAYYRYQTIVLNALREVENAIGSENYLAQEESSRHAALKAARSSLDRAQRDYESGLISILSLLETQQRVFNTERQTITLKASRLNNRVSLALALGKGV